jgi:nicotinate-nucleotide adenylyltransferase
MPASASLRLALYGGTFDPVHHGHLILARDAIEFLELDRIVFLPTGISPHKLGAPPTPPEVRRKLLESALEGEPRFELDDRELRREGPSYTIDTVEAITARLPGATLFYLIGSDNVAKLHTWHRYETLRQLVEFVVFPRGPVAASGFKSIGRRLDISSTEIRERVAQGAPIRYLVPEPVRTLIDYHRLYR